MTTRLLDPGDVLQVRQTTAIRDALRQLRAEDLQLQVQPILQLASPGKIGLEALIRFRHPVLRNQQIGELIRIAHDLGITHHIDALVIGEVAVMQRQLETTPKLADRVEYISVNISIDSLSNSSRVDGLIACLRQHAIDPSRICLELTETPGRSNHTASVSAASERLIRELNFRIHIDDFGSGLSNYQRICDAWYDSIKLDIDLVSGLGDSLRMQRYLGSFIDTVHSLGKTVVAEGIDDHGDIAAAIRLGVDAIQGFLIARPMPWEEVGHFLQESPWAQAQEIEAMVTKLRTSDRLLTDQLPTNSRSDSVPLER